MGRTRARTKTGRSLPQNRSEIKQAAASSSKADSEPSIASLLAKIQQLLTRCEYDLALKFIRRVLDRELANLEALELLGTVNVELGNIEEARTVCTFEIYFSPSGDLILEQAFSSLVTLTTSQNVPTPPSAHLYLAQLEDEDPKNALRHYETAVELLNALLKSSGESRPSSLDIEDEEIKRMAIKALISMVEIYMSDLWCCHLTILPLDFN
jgi:tetratricopeptide (TPR) repeat protein